MLIVGRAYGEGRHVYKGTACLIDQGLVFHIPVSTTKHIPAIILLFDPQARVKEPSPTITTHASRLDLVHSASALSSPSSSYRHTLYPSRPCTSHMPETTSTMAYASTTLQIPNGMQRSVLNAHDPALKSWGSAESSRRPSAVESVPVSSSTASQTR